MSKRRAQVEDCDNPNCDYSEVVDDVFEPQGYHFGRGYWAGDHGGGPIPKFYAHSEECILPALKAVIEGTL